jgi:uncharacterized protein YukE
MLTSIQQQSKGRCKFPKERIEATIDIVNRLDSNNKRTKDLAADLMSATKPMADAHHGLKGLLKGVYDAHKAQIDCEALAKEAKKDKSLEEEMVSAGVHPPPPPKIKLPEDHTDDYKTLITKLARPARAFLNNAQKVDASVLDSVLAQLGGLEAEWKQLADDIAVEIGHLQRLGNSVEKELKYWKRMQWCCRAGAVAIVAAGAAATVFTACATGGASLWGEAAAISFAMAGAGIAKSVAPEKYAKCATTMTFLTAAIQSASDLVSAANATVKDYEQAHDQISSLMTQLEELRTDCQSLVRSISSSSTSANLCRTHWTSICTKCECDPKQNIDLASQCFLAEMLLLDVEDVEEELEYVTQSEKKYKEMAQRFSDLAETSQKAYDKHADLEHMVMELARSLG